MVDPLDTATATIPGVPPLPPKRPNEAKRRELSGYQAPKQAPGCRHCRHRCKEPDSHRCGLHDFPVSLSAICSNWEAA